MYWVPSRRGNSTLSNLAIPLISLTIHQLLQDFQGFFTRLRGVRIVSIRFLPRQPVPGAAPPASPTPTPARLHKWQRTPPAPPLAGSTPPALGRAGNVRHSG